MKLYRHWDSHTEKPTAVIPPNFTDTKLLEDLKWFIAERMHMWELRARGGPPPYSEHPILASYRFCNVYRELDRQTIEFHTLLSPLRNDFPLWLLNMFYCRVVARVSTIEHTGLLMLDQKENVKVFEKLLNAPIPRYGTPYVFPISLLQRSPFPTRELFLTRFVPEQIDRIAREIKTWKKKNVYEAVQIITALFGFPFSFHWTEVLIDTAYQYPKHINLFGRFPVGPGALPTLQRIAPGNDPSYIVERLTALPIETGLTYNTRPVYLSAENWEGICCEFRKLTNLTSGTGRRRRYM